MKSVIYTIIIFLSFFMNENSIGQAPNLGAASPFALFTNTGALNNTGPTVITGHIGYNTGSLTGFPPGTLEGNGKIFENDAFTVQVAGDVSSAYSDLSTRTCTNTISVTLGMGQTITPGVSCTGAAATIDGDLIFDADNDPNAIFIIQVDGALAGSGSTNIMLANGAQACNIYWQVNGLFSLASGAYFLGTMINLGAINLSAGARIEGRLLSTTGAINIEDVEIDNICEIILPLKFVSFFATHDNNVANLYWTTSVEENTDYFMLEKRTGLTEWKPITSVRASGNSNVLKKYSAIDTDLALGHNYYRIQNVDMDGLTYYSNVISINNNKNAEQRLDLSVFPNPVTAANKFFVKFYVESVQDVKIEIFDPNGKLIYSQAIESEYGINEIEFPASLSISGKYLVRVKSNEFSGSKFLIKI